MFKKFKTMIMSWFNFGVDQLTDPVKVAELKIVKNKSAIKDTATLAADLYAEGQILIKKITKLKLDIAQDESNAKYAVTKDDPIEGKKALASLKIRTTYLKTLKEQKVKVQDQRIKLEDIIEKVKLKNDMLTTELHINKTKAKSNGNVKEVLETLSELSDMEVGGVMEEIERQGISTEYQVDKYLEVLDQPDEVLDAEWEQFKTKK